MRLFVQLDANGAPFKWPLPGTQVRGMAPVNTGFPGDAEAYEEVDLAEFGFETFKPRAMPSFNSTTENCVELPPVKNNGNWIQQWTVVAKTPEEILADKKVKVRETCDLFTFRKALLSRDAEVTAAFQTLAANPRQLMKLRWETQQVLGRNGPLVSFLTAQLLLTEDFLDDLFSTSAGN